MTAQQLKIGPVPFLVGVLTSVETRHRYFVNALRERFDVAAAGYERTGYSPATVDQYDLTPEEQAVVDQHFARRTQREELFFGSNAEFVKDSATCRAVHIEPGKLNTEETLKRLVDAGVNVLCVFGTNLIKDPLLSHFSGRMINMHLGLSPYYRGTGTNFYPLLNGEPEYVGATIHLIDKGIDSGPILHHRRPGIVADDEPHTIGCKAILAGIDGVITAVEELRDGKLNPVPQWEVESPRLYLRKHYHPRQVVELYRKLDEGLIRKYARNASDTAKQIRLVD